MIWALIFLPLLAALAAMLIRSDRIRRALLTATAATHAALTAVCWIAPPAVEPDAWVGLDAAGRLFLGIARGTRYLPFDVVDALWKLVRRSEIKD